MCRVLKVSSSGYYKWVKNRPNDGESNIDDKDFLIRTEFNRFNKKYGSPKLSESLRSKGYDISQSSIARRMRKMSLCARKKKKYMKTTDSDHDYKVADNLLDQNFTSYSPNAVWVSDITYIATVTGWMYLVIILDLFSRKIVSWQTSETLERYFVLEALNLAILRRNPSKGLIFHSDRGVQYACHDFKDALERNGFLQSMSAKGNCYDNAVAESFFKILKYELIDDYKFYGKEDLDRVLFKKIDMEYNRQRIHSTIGYKTPDQFELNHLNQSRLSECPLS